MSGRLFATQVEIVNPSTGIKRGTNSKYELEIDPSGGLQVGVPGLKIKSGGVVSAMLAAGCVLGANVGFVDDDVPNTSSLAGATIKDALDGVAGSFSDFVKHDGSIAMTGDLNLGSNKVVGLGLGTSPNDAVTLQQLQDSIALGKRWLYTTAYAGVGNVYGALKAAGYVRASQTIYVAANPSIGNSISLDGALITFVGGVPGPNQCQIGASASVTAANLVSAINNATNFISSQPTVQLGNAVRAIRENTGTGQTVHVVWRADDPPRTPTDANGLITSTNNPSAIVFVNQDGATANYVFYGAYDTVVDGAAIQGRYENAVFAYNLDEQDWTLIYANPGSGFFSGVVGDTGGLQSAVGASALYVEGDLATIDTVSSFGPGPKVTVSHRDASVLTAPFHSDDSVILRTAYPDVGTIIGDTQADFNGAADVLIGDLRGTSLRNLLANGSFIADPVGGSPYGVSLGSTVACMPGWALKDRGTLGGNTASADFDAVGPAGGPLVGLYDAKITVSALGATVKVIDFYQPVQSPETYSGRKVTVRVAVFANSNVRAFIETGAGVTLGDTHSGGGAWEVLTATTTLGSPETLLRVGVRMTALDTVYVDACTLVVGAGFTSLPFIARDELEDRQLIASMYHKMTVYDMVWGIPAGVGNTAYFTHTFPNTMLATPSVATSIVSQPAGAVCTLGATAVTDRHVVIDATEAGAWAGATLPDAIVYDLELDSRPV